MAQRGQIVALPTVVIPPENTPEKQKAETLVAHPQWKYVGPAESIRFEWQIGLKDTFFNGITSRKYATRSQPASTELKEFSTELPSISLSGLSPGYYDCEIWFKDGFADLRVIVENCVRVVEEAPPPGYTLEITVEPPRTGTVTVSPSKATYAQGERVTLTANPASGYVFDHWGGDAWGKGTSRTISITMDRDMWVVAAFREAPPVLRTLEVRIDPVGAGYVTTDPEPSGGTEHNWQFPHGTTVYVTAHSNPGYVFDWWSGEMKDTPEITAPVYPMTEHRRITAHFKKEVAPPPPPEWTWWTPGKYTQIGILAPSSAPAGSVVEVEIGLKNVHSTDVNMWPGRTRYNTTIFRVYDAAGLMHVVVPAGDMHSWFGSFTMPSKDTKILVESWYEGVDKWYSDYSVTLPIKRL